MADLLIPSSRLLVPPAFAWVPEHSTTEAATDAADLVESVGFTLDPEQRLALEYLLAEKPGVEPGTLRWAALEATIVAARQNLKTFLFKVIALYELYAVGSRLVVWTAHEFNTAMEAFRDVREIIDGSDWMRRKVRSVNEANGKEGIEFTSGQRIRFKARTKTGGRGLTGDVTFLDEAFALQPTHVGSLLPTMAAKSKTGNPRIYYGSSAGQLGSDVLRRLRDRGRAGDDPSLVYLEWCAPEGGCAQEACTHLPGMDGCALDDLENVRLANPALERRISIEFVEAMRRSLPPDEFAREFLGWWEDPVAGSSGIPLEAWEDCADRDGEPHEPVAVAIDVEPGHLSASIVVCGAGVLHVAEHHAGTAWIIPTLTELTAGTEDRPAKQVQVLGLDPTSPAGALLPDLEHAGFTVRNAKNPYGLVVLVDGREMAQACEAFLGAVLDGTLIHRDQQILNAAVAGAGRRRVGDSWKWSRRDSTVSISPLVAATIARHLWSAAPVPVQVGFRDLADYLEEDDT